jgi:protein transport protein SEC31
MGSYQHPYVKQVNRCATVAFSPTAPFIATGTMAGAIDLSFSTTACLEVRNPEFSQGHPLILFPTPRADEPAPIAHLPTLLPRFAQVFRLDYSNPSTDMPLAGGAVAANERFHRLVWGPLQTEGMPHGLIAGGLVDGSVNLYNPARIIGSPIGAEPSDGVSSGALVTKMQKHSGPVRGLEFNSFSPNLLASGAEDGELCIWDLARPAQPSLYPALKGGAGGQPTAGEVSYLAWNKKVQHILASSSLNGTTVVWDLKRQRPVISFTDPNSRRRCSAMQWNPEVATQLIVASDDDRSPSLQIWDLRNSISPAREFVGHSKGVLAMAWSQADPGLLLTCGKDNRTLCWDTAAGEVLAELPASSNWNFDVQWSSTTPGVLSTSSFDGRVGLYNLQRAGGIDAGPGTVDQYGVQQPGPKAPMKKAPAWMRRPCGATFGFGGQLVGFGVRPKGGAGEPAAAEKPSGTALTLMKVSTAVEAEVSAELEGAVSTGGSDALKTFCETKKSEATATAAKEDEETWGFLGILFEEDARRELLKHLDFGEALVAKELAESEAEAEKARSAAEAEAAAADAAAAAAAAAAPLPPVDGDEFFNNLPEPTPAAPAAPPPQPAPVDDGMAFFDDMDANGGMPKPPPSPPPAPASEPIAEAPEAVAARKKAAARAAAMAAAAAEPVEHMDAHDAAVQRALVVGDYRAAVNACIAAGRHADALVLASVGGAELWEEARSKHIAANIGRPYMRVASAVVSEDLEALVKSRPLAKWRETLAILCTYAPAESWGTLAGVLAGRLADAGNFHASTLCHICAGDVDSAVQHWLGALPPGKVAPPALHSVLEKAVVLTRATGQSSGVGLAQLVVSYAEVLVSQGQLDAAITYLDMVPDGGDAIVTLRDRIVRGGAGTTASSSAAAPAPAAPAPAPAAPSQGAYGGAYGGYSAPPAQPAHPTGTYDGYGGSSAYDGGYSQQPAQQSSYGAYGQSTHEAPPAPSLPPQPTQSAYAAYDSSPVQSAYGTQPPMGMGAAGMGAAGMGAPPPSFSPAAVAAPPPAYGDPNVMVPSAPPQRAAAAPPPPPPTSTVAAAPSFDPSASTPPPPPPATAAPAAYVPSPPAAAPPAYNPAPAQYAPAPGGDYGAYGASPAGGYGAPPAGPAGGYGTPPPAQFQPAMQPSVMQPGAPAAPAAAPAPPPAPAVPKPPANLTMDTVDTKDVKPAHQDIVKSITVLFRQCEAAAGSHPARKKEVDDASKRVSVLLWKLNRGDVSESVCGKLTQMCAALDAGDVAGATQVQVAMTTSDWDEASGFLTALKRLLKTKATLG